MSVRNLSARPGTEFTLMPGSVPDYWNCKNRGKRERKRFWYHPVELSVRIRLAKEILDQIAEIYVRQNVERNSAEAQKSLDFLGAVAGG